MKRRRVKAAAVWLLLIALGLICTALLNHGGVPVQILWAIQFLTGLGAGWYLAAALNDAA